MALIEEQRNPWRAIVAGGDYNLTSQDWEDLLTELDSLYTEAPIAQPASAPSEQKPVYQFRPECENWIDCTEQFYESWRGEKRELYAAPQPDYKAQRDALLTCLALIEPKLDFSRWENGQGEDIGKEINAAIALVKGSA